MPAYIVFEIDEWDSSFRDAYGPPTRALVTKHGGRVLASNRTPARLEGERAVPTVVVLIEFPDEAAARAWHADPDYQPLIAMRNTGSRAEAVVFGGL
jgi:uncharacterized protein (DUF1330 family)